MASGRERSMSIYTFLHLVFQRRQPVENGTKEKITEREEKDIPTLKSHMLVCLLCIHVSTWFQRQPQCTDWHPPTQTQKVVGSFDQHFSEPCTACIASINPM